MNKKCLPLLNRIQNDTLLRLADSAEQLAIDVEKYYKISLTVDEARPLFKAMQTKLSKKIKSSAPQVAAESNVNEMVQA